MKGKNINISNLKWIFRNLRQNFRGDANRDTVWQKLIQFLYIT